MGKKFSRQRSLQDDAFSAEESVNNRSRVMGQEFVDAHDPDAPKKDDRRRREESYTDPTEDPVRMLSLIHI